jgi:hypothetical protein
MAEAKPGSSKRRRDNTHSVVADSLDKLLSETRLEQVPPRLVELAEDLQAAIDAKAKGARPSPKP